LVGVVGAGALLGRGRTIGHDDDTHGGAGG